ncbi:hypothetical protein PFISCL1PPCAC_14182, partial [Pristionchus fissidentatus]
WIIYNGYCVRPYFYAGSNATVRLLQNDVKTSSEIALSEIPRDNPELFEDDLTLLTHSSASALDEDYLSSLIANWRGPISLAVSLQCNFNEDFVRDKIEKALGSLRDPKAASRFSVHVLYDRTENAFCDSSSSNSIETREESVFVASYPINTVRNVARLFSSTRYIAFADADYLFSAGFYEKMLRILRESVPVGSRNALLYRIFEIDGEEARMKGYDLSKYDLRLLISADKARVFHVKGWAAGHSMPKLPQWLAVDESSEPGLFDLTISLKRRSVWEFQFVGLRDVPLFDENFPYRTDNNLELRWEVCRAGFHLDSVSDLFVYHTLSEGVGNKDDAARKHAIKRKNMKKFAQAKKQMKERMDRLYPDTKSICP